MNIDELNKIRKVEVSPFLFTRIKQRIEESESMVLSRIHIRLIGLALALVLCLNAAAIYNFVKSKNTVASYAQALHLNSENSLY